MTTMTTRRAFLGAGALLTAAAIIRPANALQPTTDAETFARIRAILTTPRPYRPGCDCAVCRTVKTRPFRCGDCGYSGPPATFACDCATDTVRTQLDFNRMMLNKYPTAASWPKDWTFSRNHIRTRHRKLLALVSAGAIGLCRGDGHGHPAEVEDLGGFVGNCCHAEPMCPLCDGTGNGACVELNDVLAILREVNAALHGSPTL